IDLHELQQAVVDQAHLVAACDGLGERVDLLAGHLLGDEVGQQPRGEAAVLGLLAGQQGGGADRELVQLRGRGTVVEAGDGAGGHPHRIDGVQTRAAALHRTNDLVQIDRLAAAVALRYGHCRGGVGRGQVETVRRAGAWGGLAVSACGRRGVFRGGQGAIGHGGAPLNYDRVAVPPLSTRHRSPPATGGHGAALPPRARDSGKTQAGTTGVPPWVALRYRPSSPEDPWAGYHAVCLAWLSAGLRAEDAEPGSSYCRRFPGRAPQCHDGFVSITAAGQRRNWTVVRTGFPFRPTARSAPTSTTYRVYRRSQSHKLWWGRSNPAR